MERPNRSTVGSDSRQKLVRFTEDDSAEPLRACESGRCCTEEFRKILRKTEECVQENLQKSVELSETKEKLRHSKLDFMELWGKLRTVDQAYTRLKVEHEGCEQLSSQVQQLREELKDAEDVKRKALTDAKAVNEQLRCELAESAAENEGKDQLVRQNQSFLASCTQKAEALEKSNREYEITLRGLQLAVGAESPSEVFNLKKSNADLNLEVERLRSERSLLEIKLETATKLAESRQTVRSMQQALKEHEMRAFEEERRTLIADNQRLTSEVQWLREQQAVHAQATREEMNTEFGKLISKVDQRLANNLQEEYRQHEITRKLFGHHGSSWKSNSPLLSYATPGPSRPDSSQQALMHLQRSLQSAALALPTLPISPQQTIPLAALQPDAGHFSSIHATNTSIGPIDLRGLGLQRPQTTPTSNLFPPQQ